MGRVVRILRSLALAAVMAPGLAAQAPAGPVIQEPGGPRWLPTVGIRAGFDYRNSDPAIGALLRLPVPIPLLRPAITPGADLVFHDGLTDKQGMVDLTINLFGVTVGGGPVWLNTVYGDEADAPRETRQGYTVVAGARSGGGTFGSSLELRWLFVDDMKPRYITLGITYTPGAPQRPGFGG